MTTRKNGLADLLTAVLLVAMLAVPAFMAGDRAMFLL
jgi:hypothetical protein